MSPETAHRRSDFSQEEGYLEVVNSVHTYLGRLREVKSAHRNGVYQQFCDYLVLPEDAKRFIFGIDALSRSDSPYARDVLEKLGHERREVGVRAAVNFGELEPTKDNLSVLVGVADRSPYLFLAAMGGFEDRVLRIYEQSGNRKNAILSASTFATDTTYAFAEAIDESWEEDNKATALLIWRDQIVRTDDSKMNFYDLLKFANAHEIDETVTSRAQAAIQLIGVYEYLSLGKPGRYVDTSQPKQQRLEQATGLPMLQYGSTLSFISGYVESEVAVFLHSNGIYQLQVQEEIEPISNDYFSPEYVEDRLGRKFLRLRLAYLAGLIDESGFQSDMIPLPGGETVLLYWNSELFTPEQKVKFVDSLAATIRKKLDELQNIPDAETHLATDELDTLLSYLKPKEDPNAPREDIETLRMRASTGLHGLTERGFEVILDSPEEEALRQAGLTHFTYDLVDHGLTVTAWFGKFHFSFNLDFANKDTGLDYLSLENRSWLLSQVFAYLASIRNPENTGVEFVEVRVNRAGKQKLVRLNEQETDYQVGRIPHMRVLFVGNQNQQHDDQAIQDGSRKCCGVELDLLNEYFLSVQQGLVGLEELPIQYYGIIAGALEKIKVREEKPTWEDVVRFDEGTSEEKTVRALVLHNPPHGLVRERQYYQMSFIPELPAKHLGRILVRCPNAHQ